MSHWQPNNGSDDENSADDEFGPNYGGRDSTIYLIDADISGSTDQFSLCLDCIEQDLLRNIFDNPRDLAAVVFYNTEKSPVPPDTAVTAPDNCAIFMSLKPLTKESISYFKGFKNSANFFDFPTKYGTNANGKFADALWLCSRLVISCDYKLQSSTIILFTSNEQPHMPGSLDLQQTMRRATDLMENKIDVWLVPMVDVFNCNLFYKEFCCRVKGEALDAFRNIVPDKRRQMLLNRVDRRNYRKKCLRHFNFTLGDGLVIGCDLHSFHKLTKKPTAIQVLRDTNEELVAKRCHMSQLNDGETTETPRKVLPSEFFKCHEVGGKEVMFSCEELTSLKALVPSGLKLLGFKPIESLPPRRFVKRCAFLSHSDDVIKGSSKLFRALWEQCLEKRKYALCTLTYRRKVVARYVALIPEKNEDDENDDSDGKDCFRIVYVPMETDYNYLDVLDVDPPMVTDQNVDIFVKLCKKLRFEYQPDIFTNPDLERFYNEMEALAFDEKTKVHVDSTLPEVEMQEEKINKIVDGIKDAFGDDQVTAVKRSNASGSNGNQCKSAKTELSISDIEQAVKDGRGNNCTVQNLKDFIKSKGKSYAASIVKKQLVELAETIIN